MSESIEDTENHYASELLKSHSNCNPAVNMVSKNQPVAFLSLFWYNEIVKIYQALIHINPIVEQNYYIHLEYTTFLLANYELIYNL